jgi:hypothetical protein
MEYIAYISLRGNGSLVEIVSRIATFLISPSLCPIPCFSTPPTSPAIHAWLGLFSGRMSVYAERPTDDEAKGYTADEEAAAARRHETGRKSQATALLSRRSANCARKHCHYWR